MTRARGTGPRAVVAAALLAAMLGVAVAEDVLVLTSGSRVRGRIVAEEKDRVRLEVEGGGVWYPRSKIREIRRGRPTAEAERTRGARAEFAVLTREGRRAGARRFLVLQKAGGLQFEEEVVFLDAEGRPSLRVFTLERCDAAFHPVSFVVRESEGPGKDRSVTCRVRGERLEIETASKGKRETTSRPLPKGARFRFAAREEFVRRSRALGGRLGVTVYDSRDRRWRRVRYEEDGVAPHVADDGSVTKHRRIVRRRGEAAEREVLDASHRAVRAELNDGSLVAERTTREVFRSLRGGDAERVTGPESRGRTWYVDAVAGFRIAKPGEHWTFEQPLPSAVGTLVVVRREAAFATVDVQRDLSAAKDVTLERAAEALLRQCRSVSKDFEVVDDGYRSTDQGRFYWFEATARTKGTETRTRGRVFLTGGKVYRLLGACPPGFFEATADDFESVFESFEPGYSGE